MCPILNNFYFHMHWGFPHYSVHKYIWHQIAFKCPSVLNEKTHLTSEYIHWQVLPPPGVPNAFKIWLLNACEVFPHLMCQMHTNIALSTAFKVFAHALYPMLKKYLISEFIQYLNAFKVFSHVVCSMYKHIWLTNAFKIFPRPAHLSITCFLLGPLNVLIVREAAVLCLWGESCLFVVVSGVR